MIQFHPGKHTITGETVCEIFDDGRLLAVVYARPEEIAVVSKHAIEAVFDSAPPAKCTIRLKKGITR